MTIGSAVNGQAISTTATPIVTTLANGNIAVAWTEADGVYSETFNASLGVVSAATLRYSGTAWSGNTAIALSNQGGAYVLESIGSGHASFIGVGTSNTYANLGSGVSNAKFTSLKTGVDAGGFAVAYKDNSGTHLGEYDAAGTYHSLDSLLPSSLPFGYSASTIGMLTLGNRDNGFALAFTATNGGNTALFVETFDSTGSTASFSPHLTLLDETTDTLRNLTVVAQNSARLTVGFLDATTNTTLAETMFDAPLILHPNATLTLDGSSNWISVDSKGGTQFSPNTGITIETMLKLNALPGTAATVIAQGPGNSNGGWNLGVDSLGHVTFCYGGTAAITTTAELPLGQWHTLAATMSASGVVDIYIDGNLAGAGTLASTSIQALTSDLSIGAIDTTGAGTMSQYLNGSLADVTLLQGVRSVEQIQQDMVLGNQNGVIAQWGLDDSMVTSGIVTTSQGSSSLVGTLHGSAHYVNDAMAITAVGVTAHGALTAADVGLDAPTFALSVQAQDGTAVVNADGTYTYIPDAGFNGADAFTYTATDSAGHSTTRWVDVHVGYAPGGLGSVGTEYESSIQFNDGSGLLIDIGGHTPGTDYDQLVSSGSVSLNGMLHIDLVNNFTLSDGDSFNVVTGNSISGAFTQFEGFVQTASNGDELVFDTTLNADHTAYTLTAHTADVLNNTTGTGTYLVGGTGNNTFISDGGADIFIGGNSGTNTFEIVNTQFHHIEGGNDGVNTLQIGTASSGTLNLDLTQLNLGALQNINAINLGSSQSITLDQSHVAAMEQSTNSLTNTSNTVVIIGSGTAAVWDQSEHWTQGQNTTINGDSYTIYTKDNAELVVHAGVTFHHG